MVGFQYLTKYLYLNNEIYVVKRVKSYAINSVSLTQTIKRSVLLQITKTLDKPVKMQKLGLIKNFKKDSKTEKY